jgi:hypothetical protein
MALRRSSIPQLFILQYWASIFDRPRFRLHSCGVAHGWRGNQVYHKKYAMAVCSSATASSLANRCRDHKIAISGEESVRYYLISNDSRERQIPEKAV